MLNFCTVNVNALVNKIHFLFGLVKDHDLHLLSVTETWLTGGCSSSFVQLPGLAFYRGDAVGRVRKHGVGLYVADGIKHVFLNASILCIALFM